MGSTLKLALRLMLFTLASGLLLAATNAVTSGPIRNQEMRAENAARIAVFPEADGFLPITGEIPAAYSVITEIYEARLAGDIIGYCFTLSPHGYRSDIVMTLGIRPDGAIERLFVSSQGETAGLGSLVAEDEFLNQFAGLAFDTNEISGTVDAITGATVSSGTVIGAVKSAAAYWAAEFGIGK